MVSFFRSSDISDSVFSFFTQGVYCLGSRRNYDVFDLDKLSDDECNANFRFLKNDIYNLVEVLQIPNVVRCSNRQTIDPVEALCILLRRLAYPCRFGDIVPIFGRSVPELSNITSVMMAHMYDTYGHKLTNMNQPWLAPPRLQEFATAFSDEKFAREKGFVSGCGPYALEEWISGQRIILKKKKNWWGDKLVDKYPLLKATPDKITYKIVKDINAAISLAKNGEIDVINKIPWTSYVNLKEDKSITDKLIYIIHKKLHTDILP